ncbi:MAG: ABC transporter ATP-binding protein [Alphaproteobacteria bacterium]|nr:ABC transporter ATP-binding protein [Alphaproteobacteria bacterium]
MSGKIEVIVRFEAIEKTYDGLTNVVERLDLDIYKGEFLTLLGPSGSGKTTTLLMLAGFEAATSGDITLNGKSLNNVPPFKREMGIVFQNYALFPHKTVFQNVAFPLVQRRLSKPMIAERVASALDMVELGSLGDRRPNQLSGGQQQRVALARALVFEPQLVLMDEPLGALDKQLREQMQIEIKHLHEALGMTVVYVTHDQGEALTMSDRVAILNDGVIQQIDTPHEVYENPSNAFVANFVGENNNLEGRIDSVDGEYRTIHLPSGETIVARAAWACEVGAPTTLSIRPERLEINPGDSSLANQFKAVVREVIYFGDHNRIRLAMLGRDDFTARIPASAATGTLQPGQEIEVGWSADHCRALERS